MHPHLDACDTNHRLLRRLLSQAHHLQATHARRPRQKVRSQQPHFLLKPELFPDFEAEILQYDNRHTAEEPGVSTVRHKGIDNGRKRGPEQEAAGFQ